MSFYQNTWYAAAWSHEIGDELFSRTILNQEILLFRDEAGRVSAIADICPHRFAPLHLGRKIGDAVECGYHGLRFDGTGACVHNPHGDGRIPKACRVRSYPVLERYGAVWVWPGAPARSDPAALPDFGYLVQPQHKTIFGAILVRAHYELLNDNLMDASHTQFIHADMLGSDAFKRSAHEVIRDGLAIESDYRLPAGPIPAAYRMYFSDPEQPVNYSACFRWHPASLVRNTVSIAPAGGSADPPIQRIGSHFMTPETDNSTHYFFAHTRSFRLDDQAIDDQIRGWQRTGLAEQDGRMIEAVQKAMAGRDFESLQPVLFAIDPAAVRVRQALKKLIRQDAAAEPEPIGR
jgi:phenylpropionate dioxygenase-like ring-hydroxylating dioxygenase large terminal subunit